MANNLYYSINFYKTRERIDISQELSIDEKFEAAEKALDVVSVLLYVFTQAAINTEFEYDDRFAHFEIVNKVIGSFISSANANLIDLEESRKALKHSRLASIDGLLSTLSFVVSDKLAPADALSLARSQNIDNLPSLEELRQILEKLGLRS